jgi:hypothetical protein
MTGLLPNTKLTTSSHTCKVKELDSRRSPPVLINLLQKQKIIASYLSQHYETLDLIILVLTHIHWAI